MAIITRYIPLVLVLLIGVALQAFFISVDKHDTPNKAAAEFAKAYYGLDEKNMSQYICKSLKTTDAIDDYMYQMYAEASNRGFDRSYLKSSLSHIQTLVLESSDSYAVVEVTAEKRKSINPVFELVGRIFSLIQVTEIEQKVELMKEDNEWKVCGDLLHLS